MICVNFVLKKYLKLIIIFKNECILYYNTNSHKNQKIEGIQYT
jgi:hypothetical protein